MFSSSRAFPPILFAALILCIGFAHGLRCFKCGQYNEGVGSITPCINFTSHTRSTECPASSEWCIKYVSEGSTVRDCVATCAEKEHWSTRTYCCQQDECNSAPSFASNNSLAILAIAMATLLMLRG